MNGFRPYIINERWMALLAFHFISRFGLSRELLLLENDIYSILTFLPPPAPPHPLPLSFPSPSPLLPFPSLERCAGEEVERNPHPSYLKTIRFGFLSSLFFSPLSLNSLFIWYILDALKKKLSETYTLYYFYNVTNGIEAWQLKMLEDSQIISDFLALPENEDVWDILVNLAQHPGIPLFIPLMYE